MLSGQIPSLDGVRGIAIILVLLIHFGQACPVGSPAGIIARTAFGFGWSGVDLFFVLSGFLITGILVDTRTASNYFRAFYARRVLRIFPLYYAVLAIWFIIIPAIVSWGVWTPDVLHPSGEHQAWYWSYAANWLAVEDAQRLLLHLWSLCVEEQFYLVWPLVVWLFPGRRLGQLCIALAGGALLVRLTVLSMGGAWFSAYATTPCRVDALALGALVAVALRDEEWHDAVCAAWKPGVFAGVIGVAVSFVLSGGPHQWHVIMQTFGYSSMALLFAATLAGVVLRRSTRLPVLEAAPLRSFGKYSYAIYVFHVPIVSVALELLGGSGLLASWPGYLAYMAGGIATSYAVALVSWHVFEKHFLRLKRHFVPLRTPRELLRESA